MSIDFTKPVRTSDGKEVRILCADAGGGWPVVGVLDAVVYRWTLSGVFGSTPGHHFDLVQVPVKRVGFMVTGKSLGPVVTPFIGSVWAYEGKARDRICDGGYIVEVHWEE